MIFKNIIYYIKKLIKKFDKDPIFLLSSAIAFDIVLCIVPLILILLTVVGIYLNSPEVINKIATYLLSNLPFSPDYKEKFVYEMINRTKELTSHTLLSGIIGIVVLIWTVSTLFGSLRTVLNRVFHIEEDVNFFVGKLKDIMMVFVVVILFIISFTITSIFQFEKTYKIELMGIEVGLGFAESIITFIIGLVSSFIMFYILYAIIPHWKFSSRKVVLFSSINAAILFEILKFLFTVYLIEFANFSKIYGTYASLAITFVWLFYISTVFVIGAELGEIYRESHKHEIISKKREEIKIKNYTEVHGTEKTI